MSGHSKWHNIKRQKGVNDAKRSKIFSKISRLITVAARQGGGDQSANPKLRLAIQKAKEQRMPKDNVDKAIKKGTGELGGGASFEEIVYEGFGPDGGGLLLSCVTDNTNRTVSEIRSMLNIAGGNLGTTGSVSYIFDSKTKEPSFEVPVREHTETKVKSLLDLLDDHDDVQDVYHNYKFN